MFPSEKEVIWHGDSLEVLRTFPERIRQAVGTESRRLQQGLEPTNWKPMKTIGRSVREIRVNVGGAFRVIYFVEHLGAIHVLHAFQKKSQRTPVTEIHVATKRFRTIARRDH